MSEWISVHDRFPEDGQQVLALEGDTQWVCECSWIDGLAWFQPPGMSRVGVTHWMPLPESPKDPDA